jgi:hypothetical protein
MADQQDLFARLLSVVEKQQQTLDCIQREIAHMDKQWAASAYDCQCIDPDEFRRLQLDVEAIERRTRSMEKS